MSIEKFKAAMAKLDENMAKDKAKREDALKKANNEFPIEVFPKKLQHIVEVTNEDLNFPIDFIASAILHASSSAIGNTVHLQFKWREAAVIYMAFIGDPGTGKSHPIKWAYAPLYKIDDLYYNHYEKLLAEYETAKLFNKKDPGVEKPILKQLIVSDTTIEALNVALVHNKRCVAIVADELSGFFGSMGRYQQQYLSLFNRQPHIIDRKTSPRIRIKEPFVSIIGTIQTDIFADVMEKGNRLKNGFLDRLLLVNPKNISSKKWKPKVAGNNAEAEWEEIINKLLKSLPLYLDEKGNVEPQIIHFTKEAEDSVMYYQNNLPDYDVAIDDKTIDRLTKKMEVYFLRLCIILQLLKWTCGEAEKSAIDADTVKGAIVLTGFYKRNAFAVWEDISNKNALDKLTDQQKEIYQKLTLTFKTGSGVTIAANHGMAERTFKNWIKNASLFKRIGYGSYEKVYKR